MSPRINPADLLGLSRLAKDATAGMVEVAATMHGAIVDAILPGTAAQKTAGGSAAAVYAAIQTITGLVGDGLDAMVASLASTSEQAHSTPEREAVLAALNGIVGHHLAETRNPLAIPMTLRQNGVPLQFEAQTGSRVLVLAHGLCMNDLQWTRSGHNHGAALAAEFGWTPVYVNYNSGLHVSTNGRAFAAMLEALVGQWPEPISELAIIGHSNGGLLARSAHYYGTQAGHRWPRLLRSIVFLGTPHHGSLLERGGNWLHVLLAMTPYSAPLASIASIRSAGITDLRYGNLLDEDWHDTDRFHPNGDRRRALPLPEGILCFAIAANQTGGDVFGDGLVGVDSALGRHSDPLRALAFPASHQWVGSEMNHWDLLSHPSVYTHIRKWLVIQS